MSAPNSTTFQSYTLRVQPGVTDSGVDQAEIPSLGKQDAG